MQNSNELSIKEIKNILKKKRISQKKAAKFIGISEKTLNVSLGGEREFSEWEIDRIKELIGSSSSLVSNKTVIPVKIGNLDDSQQRTIESQQETIGELVRVISGKSDDGNLNTIKTITNLMISNQEREAETLRQSQQLIEELDEVEGEIESIISDITSLSVS